MIESAELTSGHTISLFMRDVVTDAVLLLSLSTSVR